MSPLNARDMNRAIWGHLRLTLEQINRAQSVVSSPIDWEGLAAKDLRHELTLIFRGKYSGEVLTLWRPSSRAQLRAVLDRQRARFEGSSLRRVK